jgi:hypothetical protein
VKQDQAEINKIIAEASKGSKFYEVGNPHEGHRPFGKHEAE